MAPAARRPEPNRQRQRDRRARRNRKPSSSRSWARPNELGCSTADTAARPAIPPASRGATVRHHSSMTSAASRSPLSVGPPSQIATSPSSWPRAPARSTSPVPGPDGVDRHVRGVGGGDHEAGAAGEEGRGPVEVGTPGDDADALARLPGRPVALGPGGAGADHDHVGELPQVGEHPLVGGATETTRALTEGDGAVERGDHVHQQPGAPVDAGAEPVRRRRRPARRGRRTSGSSRRIGAPYRRAGWRCVVRRRAGTGASSICPPSTVQFTGFPSGTPQAAVSTVSALQRAAAWELGGWTVSSRGARTTDHRGA